MLNGRGEESMILNMVSGAYNLYTELTTPRCPDCLARISNRSECYKCGWNDEITLKKVMMGALFLVVSLVAFVLLFAIVYIVIDVGHFVLGY